MRMFTRIAAALAIVAALVAPAMAADTIKVGAILAVTGPASFLGAPEARTLEMLVEDLNARGGVDGRKIELVVKDTGGNPEKAISFAKQLIEEDKVFAIIGPATSGETIAVKPIAEEARTIVSPRYSSRGALYDSTERTPGTARRSSFTSGAKR